jgi:hypothetical protein
VYDRAVAGEGDVLLRASRVSEALRRLLDSPRIEEVPPAVLAKVAKRATELALLNRVTDPERREQIVAAAEMVLDRLRVWVER